MEKANRTMQSVVSTLLATSPSFWLSLGLLVVGVVWFQFLPASLVKYLNSEQGPFEQFSVAFLATAALLALASWWQSRCQGWLAGGVVLIYATLRELDFQTMFTHRSVMSLGYFTRARAPLPEKLLVFLAIAPCLIAIAYLLRRAWQSWRDRRVSMRDHAAARAMAFWIVVLFGLSHFSDRTSWFRLQGHVEDFVEAILALAVLLLVVEIKTSLLKQPDCGTG
jgi:ABC-type dipeptide/oligopeptide/nickel transport system permease component